MYFPAGQPFGFETWNSVRSRLFGAIVRDDSSTVWPSSNVHLARSVALGADPLVATDGAASTATVRAKWTFEDGQTVDESTRTIAPGGRERTEFHIAKPNGWPAGKYKVEVFLNDQSAETKTFEVQGR